MYAAKCRCDEQCVIDTKKLVGLSSRLSTCLVFFLMHIASLSTSPILLLSMSITLA